MQCIKCGRRNDMVQIIINLRNKRLLRTKKYGIFIAKKGCDCMAMSNIQQVTEPTENAKLEFYRLIGEGYKAMQDGRTSTIDEVREKLKKRREELG